MEGIERPLKLYCDNKSAIFSLTNNMSMTKSKHIDIKFLVVGERVQTGQNTKVGSLYHSLGPIQVIIHSTRALSR